jgi:hypothetical protein
MHDTIFNKIRGEKKKIKKSYLNLYDKITSLIKNIYKSNNIKKITNNKQNKLLKLLKDDETHLSFESSCNLPNHH